MTDDLVKRLRFAASEPDAFGLCPFAWATDIAKAADRIETLQVLADGAEDANLLVAYYANRVEELTDTIRLAAELIDADGLIEAYEKLISAIGDLK